MYLAIAWRNLWRNPRRTLIILTAVVIGIMSMVVLSAFSRGMMEGMVNNAIDNLIGHVRIQDPSQRIDPSITGRIQDSESLVARIQPALPEGALVTSRIKVDGLLSTSREHIGVVLVGINPDRETGLSFIGKGVSDGRMIRPNEKSGLVVGQALLDRIDGRIGSKVVVMSQDASGETVSKGFRIRGVYRTELKATEKVFVFASLATIRSMLGVGSGATEVSIHLPQTRGNGGTSLLLETVASLNRILSTTNYRAEDWTEMLPSLHAYLKMFDGYMLIWFVVVFIAMGFGLVNTMLMAVYERMREFGLQRALGMRSSRIVRMVMIETLLLLVTGAIIANSLSVLLIMAGGDGLDLSRFAQGTEMFGVSRIVVPQLVTKDVFMANGVVLVLGMLVGLYPALRAARFTPVETMRQI